MPNRIQQTGDQVSGRLTGICEEKEQCTIKDCAVNKVNPPLIETYKCWINSLIEYWLVLHSVYRLPTSVWNYLQKRNHPILSLRFKFKILDYYSQSTIAIHFNGNLAATLQKTPRKRSFWNEI